MSNNFYDLSNVEIDVLKEIGNIGAGNAATALALMLNKKVDMNVPRVKVLEFKEIGNVLDAEELVVGILLNMTGDITATIMFLIEVNSAFNLINNLMGRDKTFEGEFDDLELSALKEIGNILTGSYISALTILTNLNLKASVPDIAIDMAAAILSVPAIEFGKVGDTVLYIETEFVEGNQSIKGNFILVPDVDSYATLLKVLGVNC